MFVPLETPGHPAGGGDPATNPDYTVTPPGRHARQPAAEQRPAGDRLPDEQLDGTGSTTWGNPVAFSSDPAVQSGWGDTVFPTVYFPPGGEPHTATELLLHLRAAELRALGSPGNETGSISVKIESSITFSSPGLSSGREARQKRRARRAPAEASSTPGCSGRPARTRRRSPIGAAPTLRRTEPLSCACAIAAARRPARGVAAERARSSSQPRARPGLRSSVAGTDLGCSSSASTMTPRSSKTRRSARLDKLARPVQRRSRPRSSRCPPSRPKSTPSVHACEPTSCASSAPSVRTGRRGGAADHGQPHLGRRTRTGRGPAQRADADTQGASLPDVGRTPPPAIGRQGAREPVSRGPRSSS